MSTFFKEQETILNQLCDTLDCKPNECLKSISKLNKKYAYLESLSCSLPETDHIDYPFIVDQCLNHIATCLNCSISDTYDRIKQIKNKLNQSEKSSDSLDISLLKSTVKTHPNGLKSLVYCHPSVHAKLRDDACSLANELEATVCLCATQNTDSIQIVIATHSSLTSSIKANSLLSTIAHHIDGKGGGRDHLAMGAGKNTQNISQLFSEFENIIQNT